MAMLRAQAATPALRPWKAIYALRTLRYAFSIPVVASAGYVPTDSGPMIFPVRASPEAGHRGASWRRMHHRAPGKVL